MKYETESDMKRTRLLVQSKVEKDFSSKVEKDFSL